MLMFLVDARLENQDPHMKVQVMYLISIDRFRPTKKLEVFPLGCHFITACEHLTEICDKLSWLSLHP